LLEPERVGKFRVFSKLEIKAIYCKIVLRSAENEKNIQFY